MPFCAKKNAVDVPMMPPPMTTTSARGGSAVSEGTGSTLGPMGDSGCRLPHSTRKEATDQGRDGTANLCVDAALLRVVTCHYKTPQFGRLPKNRGNIRGGYCCDRATSLATILRRFRCRSS